MWHSELPRAETSLLAPTLKTWIETFTCVMQDRHSSKRLLILSSYHSDQIKRSRLHFELHLYIICLWHLCVQIVWYSYRNFKKILATYTLMYDKKQMLWTLRKFTGPFLRYICEHWTIYKFIAIYKSLTVFWFCDSNLLKVLRAHNEAQLIGCVRPFSPPPWALLPVIMSAVHETQGDGGSESAEGAPSNCTRIMDGWSACEDNWYKPTYLYKSVNVPCKSTRGRWG